MKTYTFDELVNSDSNNSNSVFERTIYISLKKKNDSQIENKNVRDKGVDTIMLECENGATIIIEKDCKSEKILGIEIFE